MPDRAGAGRVAGALAAGVLAALLAAPAATAQTFPPPSSTPDTTQPAPPSEPPPPGSWEASRFDAPFDQAGATLTGSVFDISGTLRYQRTGPADRIGQVEVRVVDDPTDSFTPAEGCPLPEPVTSGQDRPRTDGFAAEHPFLVEAVSIPCNGRYLVQAEGRLDDPQAPPHTLQQSFLLEAPPAPVTGLAVTVDGAARSVTATFQPLADTDLAFDAIGYVLERSGPESATFVDVASIRVGAEPELVDPLADAPAGAYTYRVRAVRAGAAGEVRSSPFDTESDTVEVTGGPKSSGGPVTGPRGRGSTGPRSGGRLSVPSAGGRSTTSTTLDTGFEDTLDYGEPGSERASGDDPLAGQSIIEDEAEGMGLAVPAAGALVMLGWAGHILYLNRLAKQL